MDLGRWDQAQQAAQAGLDLDAFDIDVRRNYAYVLESLGDYFGAAAQYEQAIAINPNLAYLYLALGRTYRVLGRTNDAIDQFLIAQGMDPQNPISYLEIGWTYHTVVGDPNAALEFLEQAVELDATYQRPWMRIGTVHFVQGNWAESVLALEQAAALADEDDIDILVMWGLSHANLGECNEAARLLREALALAEGNERVEALVQEGFDLCAEAGVTLGTPTPVPAPAA